MSANSMRGACLIVMVLACASLAEQALAGGDPLFSVRVANMSAYDRSGPLCVGLPVSYSPMPVSVVSELGDSFPGVIHDDGRGGSVLLSKVRLPAVTTETMQVVPAAGEPFYLAEWVADELAKLLPHFVLDIGGTDHVSLPLVFGDSLQLIEFSNMRQVWKIATQIPQGPVFITAFFYIYSGSEVVEFEIRASYGSTAAVEPRERNFGSLRMIIGELPHVDWRVHKGLAAPYWTPDPVLGGIRWEQEIVAPRQWMRGSTREVTGALLCLPPYEQIQYAVSDPRVFDLLGRQQAPMLGVASGWDGHWGALGAVPEPPVGAAGIQAARIALMAQEFSTPGDDDDPRQPYSQPPNSSQTGEQGDFGVMRGENVVSMNDPSMLYHLRYAVQGWMLRPYANREPDGSPVLAANHPDTRTYNLRPDERFSAADMLGWPNPVGWFTGWSTSDDQHRSDNLLIAMYLLTRSYSIEATIEDIIECQRMDLDLHRDSPAWGSGLASPRGWGRPVLALCHYYAAGFVEVEPLIEHFMDKAWSAASMQLILDDPTRPVRVLSDNEAKYGWTEPGSTVMIRAWLPWQESIAVIGLAAVYELFGDERARTLAIESAKTIARYGFFQVGDDWHYCYAVRWRTYEPGMPLPPSAYNLNEPNYDVFVTGATRRWTIPALKILTRLDPNSPHAALAAEIIAAEGPPMSWDDSCWWAVGQAAPPQASLPEQRTFLMGMVPWPHAASPAAFIEAFDIVEAEADMVAHHLIGGIPWPEALAGTAYHPNAEGLLQYRASRGSGKATYVSVDVMNGVRDGIAPYWGESENMALPPEWEGKGFDDPDVIAAYVSFCRDLVRRFDPDYFAYGIEVQNISDPVKWDQFLTLAAAVYPALKADDPFMQVFATLQTTVGDDQLLKSRALELMPFTDMVAVSVYPYLNMDDPPATSRPTDIAQDRLEQWRDLAPGKPFGVSETAWPAENLVMPALGVNTEGRESWQRDYINWLGMECNRLDAEFFIWFVPRDYDDMWDNYLEPMGASEWTLIWKDTGLLDGDAEPRSALATWRQWGNLPLQ